MTDAKLSYDHFEVDHVDGVGGDLAKMIGKAAKAGLERLRRSLDAIFFTRRTPPLSRRATPRKSGSAC